MPSMMTKPTGSPMNTEYLCVATLKKIGSKVAVCGKRSKFDLESVRRRVWELEHGEAPPTLFGAYFTAVPHVQAFLCGDHVVLAAHGLYNEDQHEDWWTLVLRADDPEAPWPKRQQEVNWLVCGNQEVMQLNLALLQVFDFAYCLGSSSMDFKQRMREAADRFPDMTEDELIAHARRHQPVGRQAQRWNNPGLQWVDYGLRFTATIAVRLSDCEIYLSRAGV